MLVSNPPGLAKFSEKHFVTVNMWPCTANGFGVSRGQYVAVHWEWVRDSQYVAMRWEWVRDE